MQGDKSYWVYILASRSRVLYTGVTNDLARRLAEHRSGDGSRFAHRYYVRRLVYAEEYRTPIEAIEREKQIKRWRREKKLMLINAANPTWRDGRIQRHIRSGRIRRSPVLDA